MKISVRMIPYIIVCIMLSYTWYIILSTEYQATWKHYVALGIVVVNFVAYLMRFNFGLAITGALLLLATFNAVGLLPDIVYTSYSIRIAGKEMESPSIQGKSFLLFLLYLILNWSYWTGQYKVYKSSKMDRE
jgi:hypothetical protein